MRILRALVLVAVAVLVMRSTWLAGLAVRGVWVDAAALATVLWSLRERESWGATFGFLMGLASDLDAGHMLGRQALALSVLGWSVGRLSGTLVRDSFRTQFSLLSVVTLVHQAYTLSFEMGPGWISQWFWVRQVMVTTLVTSLAGVLLLGIFRQLRGRPLFDDVPIDSRKAF